MLSKRSELNALKIKQKGNIRRTSLRGKNNEVESKEDKARFIAFPRVTESVSTRATGEFQELLRNP